jgi:hypothetical protein
VVREYAVATHFLEASADHFVNLEELHDIQISGLQDFPLLRFCAPDLIAAAFFFARYVGRTLAAGLGPNVTLFTLSDTVPVLCIWFFR